MALQSPYGGSNVPFADDNEDAPGPGPQRKTMAPASADASATAPADASARVSIGSQVPDNTVPQLTAPTPNPQPTAAAPVAPQPATQSDYQPVAFQGAKQIANLLTSQPDPYAAKAPQPITASTPAAQLQRAWDGARWNYAPGDGSSGASWQNSPDGGRTFGVEDQALLRPPSGPGSLAATAALTPPAAPAAAAPAASTVTAPAPTAAPVAPIGGASTAVLSGNTAPNYLRSPDAAPYLSMPSQSPAQSGDTPNNGVTVNGHELSYGAMVNGVPTFSDGSGVGGIPRTMSDDTIKGLGNQLNISAPATTALASDVLGYTPTQDQAVASLTRPTSQPITGSRPSNQDFAASDRLDIASMDPRSALGIAARNLSIDAQYGSGPARRAALGSLQALQGGVDHDEQITAQQQDQASQQQNARDLENMRGQYSLADATAQARLAQLRREGHPVTLTDGTLGVMDPISGNITPATLPNGATAKTTVPKPDAGIKRSDQVMDQISQTATQLAKSWMPPQNDPTAKPPYQQFRQQAAQLHGLRTATNPTTGQRMVEIDGNLVNL